MKHSSVSLNLHSQPMQNSWMKQLRPYFLKMFASLIFIGFCCIAGVQSAFGQWSSSTVVNTAVSNASGDQTGTFMVSDGSGGVIMTWGDFRNGVPDIYAQRINAAGVPVWTVNGIVVCNDPVAQGPSGIISDGAGGAIIVWSDHRNGLEGDIYAQRINAAGLAQWTVNGVAVCIAPINQGVAGVISDGAGGAILCWRDRRFGGNYDVYAQRINGAGVAQWIANGIPICTESSVQDNSALASDGAGGAIITWHDRRNGNFDIYAQRVDASGIKQWTTNGKIICNAVNDQMDPYIVHDGAGGGIITWIDGRTDGITYDIFAQRINAAGTVQWTANGVSFCSAAGDQIVRNVAPDGSGGIMMAWDDKRNGANNVDIYTQRITGDGVGVWTANGLAVCTTVNNQQLPNLVSDGSGGAILTWYDEREYPGSGPGVTDIYAQRVSGAGGLLWTANGVVISIASLEQYNPHLVTDGTGGAIIAWDDYRDINSSGPDIYVQNVHANGTIGSGTVALTMCQGGSILLTSALAGTTFQWQVNTGSGYTNISDNSNYAGTGTAILQLSNIPSGWYGYLYRCVVDGANREIYELKFSNHWTGSSTNNWDNPANWNCGNIPGPNTDVVINSGTIIVNINTTVRTLTLATGVSFAVIPGIIFTVTH